MRPQLNGGTLGGRQVARTMLANEHRRRAAALGFAFIGYCALAPLYKLLWRDPSNPAWLQALALVVGVLQGTPARHVSRESRVTTSAVVAFVLAIVLMVTATQLFLLVVGSSSATVGLWGAKTGRFVESGRVGPSREYVGRAAYSKSAIWLLSGAGAIAYALITKW
jgi:hypothetical protein